VAGVCASGPHRAWLDFDLAGDTEDEMSLLESLRSSEQRSYWRGPYNIKDPLTGIFSEPSVSSGVSVNEQNALTYSAVWASVQRISGDVGSLPLVLYKRVGDGKEPLRDHPTYRLLHDQPNPDMTAVVFRETLQAHLLTWGNAYAEIEWRGDGRPQAFWPIDPSRVTPERNRAGNLYYKVKNYNNADTYLESQDIIHIPGLGFDGTCGYSVIRQARESIGLGMAMERFGGAFFGNGATMGGYLTHTARLSEPAKKNLRESFNARHRGVDRAHNVGILEEGMTYTPLGVPPDDAQFLESRKFQVAEIARWFQIPPHMLGDLERATFSNIEQQQIDYHTGTLRRWLVRWEQEFNRKVVLQSGSQFVEHTIDGLLRGDIESRYQAYAVGRQWGWLSADDVRSKENMNPLPDEAGQIYLVPINMAPADRIDEVIDKQVEPTPAPVVRASGEDMTPAVLAQLEVLRQEHADRIAQLTNAQTADREVTERVLDRLVVESRDGKASVEERAATLAAQATESRQRLDQVQSEWIKAQEAHQAKVEAEQTERARLQAELTRQAELVAALESDVAERTTQLDEAREAHAQAVHVAYEARTAEQLALSEKVVSAADAAAAKEAAREADARVDSAVATASEYAREVGDLKAKRDHAASALLSIQSKLTSTSDELTQIAQTNAERAEALLKLEAELQAAKAAAQLERERADHAKAALEATQARAEAAEGDLIAERNETAARLASVLGSHRSLIAAEVGRLARREAEKARRYQATPEKLRRWLETFATVEAPICVEALLPAVRTHLAWMRSADDPSVVTAQLVKAHLDTFEARLKSAADAESDEFHATLEAVLQRWEADRPTEVADAMLQEGIAYVRAR
jgi:HK97 family phage portal protein